MSNLIKAQQIAYAENIKKLDMNQRADEYQKQFVDQYISDNIALKQINFSDVAKTLEEQKVIMAEDVNFVPGIATEPVQMREDTSDNAVVGLEARLRDKRHELEELDGRIEAIHEEADRIIEDANSQAQAIMLSAREEAEAEKAKVMEQARQEGLEAGREDIEKAKEEVRAELEATKQQYREEFLKQVEELEPAFVEILIKYVQKLTGIYAEDKKEIILHLIDNAMKDKRGDDNFIIRVSEADFAMASYSKDAVKHYLNEDASIEVVADKLLSKNQCMIETDSRIFDCSLDGQMLSLIEDIRLLAEKE